MTSKKTTEPNQTKHASLSDEDRKQILHTLEMDALEDWYDGEPDKLCKWIERNETLSTETRTVLAELARNNNISPKHRPRRKEQIAKERIALRRFLFYKTAHQQNRTEALISTAEFTNSDPRTVENYLNFTRHAHHKEWFEREKVEMETLVETLRNDPEMSGPAVFDEVDRLKFGGGDFRTAVEQIRQALFTNTSHPEKSRTK
jgi:hypothetical protein